MCSYEIVTWLGGGGALSGVKKEMFPAKPGRFQKKPPAP